jgi:hypothetical protein
VTRRLVATVTLIASAVGATGCGRQHADTAQTPAAVAADTLRGTFVLEGSDPMPAAVLRTSRGRVVLDGVPPSMRGLVQLDLCVRGTPERGGRFRVETFLVRAADGHPAWDGTVQRDEDGFTLRLPDGTSHALRGPPPAFARLVDRRVWVTETPARTVAAYGVIS